MSRLSRRIGGPGLNPDAREKELNRNPIYSLPFKFNDLELLNVFRRVELGCGLVDIFVPRAHRSQA